MIESYSFGCMNISGNRYTSDLIILPDGRILDSWWRQSGHQLMSKDIIPLIEAKPEVIVAGTGASGLMKPVAELEELMDHKGIEFIVQPTKKAADIYNQLINTKKVGACFHLTC